MQTTTRASDWLNAMSARLQQRWPSLDPQRLDDLALALWGDENLRAMSPDDAADRWLAPVGAEG